MIDVHVNKLYEAGQTSMDQDPVERSGISLRQRWRGPLKCLPCTAVLVERWEKMCVTLVCQPFQSPGLASSCPTKNCCNVTNQPLVLTGYHASIE